MVTETQKALLTMREYQPEDEPLVLSLLNVALGESESKPRTAEFWRWKHFDNPHGPSFIRVACAPSGQVVGVRAFMQWRFQMGQQTVRAVRAVDTATHPDFQRMGIFSGLTKQVVEDVRRDGVPMIFNTPNVASGSGYLRMGWQRVGSAQPMILILNPARFFRNATQSMLGIGKSGTADNGEFFRQPLPGADSLLEQGTATEELLAKHQSLAQDRSAISTCISPEYLIWRYSRHPGIKYYAVLEDSDSRLWGASVLRTDNRFRLKGIVLATFWLRDQDEKLCRRLLNRVKSAVNADYLMAYAQPGSFLQGALKRCGFRSLPPLSKVPALEKRVYGRQKPGDLMVRPLVESLPVDPLQLKNWGVSMGDLEVF